MENVIRTRPKRSLARRLFAPAASLAMLAGGGWGAYHYYGSEQISESSSIEIAAKAHSASKTATQDELKLLFASDDKAKTATSPEPTAPVAKKLTPESGDRYASVNVKPMELSAPPELPPLVDQTKAVSPITSDLGDRYATATTMPSIPTEEKSPADKKLSLAQDETNNNTEIARGQEPNTNPLRVTGQPTELDARAAFGAALTGAPKTAPPQSAPKQPTVDQSNKLNAALQNARPLQSNPFSPTPNSDRYQAATTAPIKPTPAAQPMVAQNQRPAPPLNLSPQRTQTPVPTSSNTNPFGAPPASLQTARTPKPTRQMPSLDATSTSTVHEHYASQGITPTPGLANHPGTGRPGERLLEGAQTPSITIQKLAPEQIQVGKRCTFAIRVHNSGQRTAQSVQIRDEVPLGTELVGTAPRATVSGSEIIWDLGTLSPGEERTVEMELLPAEEGELGSVATVSFTAQASAKSRCTRPELALRLTSKPQVHVGEQQIVQIEVSNPGSGDATGVMLLESVPAGVSHAAGPALEFEIGTLKAGETRRLELVLTAEQAGKINNVMTARADASLQVEANCEFEVIAPQLQLSVEGPQKRFLERPATYRVSIDNPGTAPAKEVQLVTHLPKGMQFVSANNMGEYDSATHSVHWSLAELPARERGSVELIALPIEAGEQTLQIATKADLGLEDRTDKQVTVEGLSALMFEVIDVEGLIEIGGETTYEIRVQNQGSKAATNVQIVAIMPAGIRPITGQGETRHAIQGERVIFAPLPQLAPKSDTTFRIQAQGVRPGDQRVRVQITSDDTQQPITKEVSTRVYADE